MTRRTLSYVVYGVWFLAWVVLELLGIRKRARWFSLSETVWGLERLPYGVGTAIRVVLACGLGLLAVHLASPGWP